jgi:hypothetical protein
VDRLAQWLRERGIGAVLTGGTEPAEVEFAAAVAAQMPAGTVNLVGQLTLAQSACAIAGARVYVGPDTLTTHMAAAIGVPTVALYGPFQPGEMGTMAQELRRDHVAVAAHRQPIDRQRPPGPGGGRLRALHAGGVRPARRELLGVPAPVAASTVTAAVERALQAQAVA